MKVNEPRSDRTRFNGECKLREIAKNEIVIEFDTSSRALALHYTKVAMARLNYRNYNFSVFDHGGRSPHIHVYNVVGLEEQDPEVISEYKRLFLGQIAPFKETDVGLNTATSHLVATEYQEHFKHHRVKQLLFSTGAINNLLSLTILEKAQSIVRAQANATRTHSKMYDNEWLINWASKEELPYGKWNNTIAKNIAILVYNTKLNKEKVLAMFEPRDRISIEGWMNWVKRTPRIFGFHELCNFCDHYNLDLKNIMKRYGSNDTR
jgi:hypothetical protein